jgi:hypothetical protein
MNDADFEKLLRETAADYRTPPPVPLDGLWATIEREAFGHRAKARRGSPVSWGVRAASLAAAAALGLMIGRITAPAPPIGETPADQRASASVPNDPLHAATTEYLGETAALISALPGQVAGPDQRFLAQARELLSTTRLLLDSPALTDPDLAGLLEDLELVLAQIARLPAASGAEEEVDLITETLEFRDVLARLRSVTVTSTLTSS